MTDSKTMHAKDRLWSLLALAGAAALAPVLACGGGNKPADNPNPNGSAAVNSWGAPSGQWGAPPPGGTMMPPPGGTMMGGGMPPPGGTMMPPPGGTMMPPPGASSAAPAGTVPGLPGVPVDPNLLQQIMAAGTQMMGGGTVQMGDPIELGIKAASVKYAPGMTGEGQISKDTLTQGGHKEMLITLQGGKCYTIIAFSPPGQITNVDLHLLTPPFYNMMAGQDTFKDNTAVVGANAQALCPMIPMPVQYKLDVQAIAGQGAVGVQVFSKPK